jgi:hypothetical protein
MNIIYNIEINCTLLMNRFCESVIRINVATVKLIIDISSGII